MTGNDSGPNGVVLSRAALHLKSKCGFAEMMEFIVGFLAGTILCVTIKEHPPLVCCVR